MNIYMARYKNALRMAAKVNRYLKKGYHVFWRGEPTKLGFVLQGTDIVLKHSEYSCTLYYGNDKEWDHGYYTKISEWNEKFNRDFEVYLPSAKVVL